MPERWLTERLARQDATAAQLLRAAEALAADLAAAAGRPPIPLPLLIEGLQEGLADDPNLEATIPMRLVLPLLTALAGREEPTHA